MATFSIVIPAYNYASYLPQAIDSALAQSGEREVVVVNDGSTDNTLEVLAPYLDASDVVLINQANAGVAAARNVGADRATGKYLVFLDADDRLLPDALQRFGGAFEEGVDFVLGAHYRIHPEKKRHVSDRSRNNNTSDRQANFSNFLRKKLRVATGAVVVRREILETLRFPEHLRLNEDIVFIALLLARHDGVSLGEPVLEVVRHDGSLRSSSPLDLKQTVDTLFDPELLPAECHEMRNEFYADRCLAQFRIYFRTGRHALAREFYRMGIKANPPLLLRFNYLSKYLRALVK